MNGGSILRSPVSPLILRQNAGGCGDRRRAQIDQPGQLNNQIAGANRCRGGLIGAFDIGVTTVLEPIGLGISRTSRQSGTRDVDRAREAVSGRDIYAGLRESIGALVNQADAVGALGKVGDGVYDVGSRIQASFDDESVSAAVAGKSGLPRTSG